MPGGVQAVCYNNVLNEKDLNYKELTYNKKRVNMFLHPC